MSISTFIPGIPAPQGSKRAFIRGGHARLVEDNAKTRPWRDSVTHALVAERNGTGPIDGAVEVELVFYFPRPKAHFTKKGQRPTAPVHVRTKPDLDKLVRAILDSATGAGVWRDDSQVALITARKWYINADGTPGVRVQIGQIEKA